MEIELKNIGYKYKNKKLLDKIDLVFKEAVITGITGEYKSLLLEIIDAKVKPTIGEVVIDGNQVNNKNLLNIRKNVVLVTQLTENQFSNESIKEEMYFVTNYINYNSKNIEKRMYESLKIVGLDDNYLDRTISSLSSGEKKLVQIAISLVSNPKVIIFDEPFEELDYDNKKLLIKLIKRLKHKYHKTIIIASNDINMLYELTDEIVILKNGKLKVFLKTQKALQDIELLEKLNIEVPNLVKFTNKARAKKIRLMQHRDILDLIKDIYKHV
ncbi:MAG: ABC transporter ATP-binding protein [Bacilli bacterium]|nr:ABC transporter ATP-binding protein [Bacilli bacterium]